MTPNPLLKVINLTNDDEFVIYKDEDEDQNKRIYDVLSSLITNYPEVNEVKLEQDAYNTFIIELINALSVNKVYISFGLD